MKNKDKYKKEMNSISPSRGLVEDTINMIKNKGLEKKSFFVTYRKQIVAFACVLLIFTIFGVYKLNSTSTVLQKNKNEDIKASKYISTKESDKEFYNFMKDSGMNNLSKDEDNKLYITVNGETTISNDYNLYDGTMNYVKYINRNRGISVFYEKKPYTVKEQYKYLNINLNEWVILNINDKYKICVPDSLNSWVVVIDLTKDNFTFYKLYINPTGDGNDYFLRTALKGLTDGFENGKKINGIIDKDKLNTEYKDSDSKKDSENDKPIETNDNTKTSDNTQATEEKTKVIPRLYGDVNRDGIVNTRDAGIIRQFISGQYGKGFDPIQYELADVNGDGEITGLDATLIQYSVIKAIDFDGKRQIKNVVLYGDVSKSGRIEQADYDILNSYLEGNMDLDNIQKSSADVNDDGKVNRVDLLVIEGMIKGYFSYEMINPVLNYTLLGDVNGDGYIRSNDATYVGQYLEKSRILDPQQMKNADVNADGKVDAVDRKLIQEFVVRMHDDTLPFIPIK